MKNWLKGLTSRKFILALISAAVAFVNFLWDLGLSVDQVLVVTAPLLGFIGIEGLGDYGERKAAAAAVATQRHFDAPDQVSLEDLERFYDQNDDVDTSEITPGQ